MKLIDADALLNAMDKRYKEKEGVVLDNLAEGFMQMEKLIKEQPIAYDVEKVEKENKALKNSCRIITSGQMCFFCSIECENRTTEFRGNANERD